MAMLFAVGLGLRFAGGDPSSGFPSRARFLDFGAMALPSSSTLGFFVYFRFGLGSSADAPSMVGAAGALILNLSFGALALVVDAGVEGGTSLVGVAAGAPSAPVGFVVSLSFIVK